MPTRSPAAEPFACLVRMDAAETALAAFGTSWSIGHTGGGATWQFGLGIAAKAALIHFTADGYSLTTDGQTRPIRDGESIDLGPLALGFRKPHAWTPAAALVRLRGPRADGGIDRLLLGCGPLLFGDEADCHVSSHPSGDGCGETIVLARSREPDSDAPLVWKRLTGPLDAETLNRIVPPSFIETDTLRLHLEPLAA